MTIFAMSALPIVPFAMALFDFRISSIPIGYLTVIISTVILIITSSAYRYIIIPFEVWLTLGFLILQILLVPLLAKNQNFQLGAHVKETVLLFGNFLLFFGVFAITHRYPERLQRLRQLLVAFSLWSIIMMVISYVTIYSQFSFPRYLFFTPYRAPHFMLLLFVLWALLMTRPNNKLGLSEMLAILAILVLGSRAGYVSTFVAIIVMMLLKGNITKLIIFTVQGLLLVTLLVILVPVLRERFMGLIEISELITLNFDAASDRGSGSKRILFWLGAFELFKQSPIFGIGLGTENFQQNFPHQFLVLADFHILKPHNSFLYFASNAGILGLLWFTLTFFGRTIRLMMEHIFLHRKMSDQMCITVAFMIGIAVYSMTNQLETSPVSWVLFAVIIGSLRRLERNQRSSPRALKKQFNRLKTAS